MFYNRLVIPILFLFVSSQHLFAQKNIEKNIIVSNSMELNDAIIQAKPNQHIILKNGVWQNLEINFKSKANANNPITLESETAGKVILSGSSKINIYKPHLIVNGLVFKNGSIDKGSVVTISADSCKIFNLAIIDYNPNDSKIKYIWVQFKGSYNVLENCFFKGKNNDQQVIVNNENDSRYNVIRSCYFKDIPLIEKNNGREIIKIVGYGHSDQSGEDGAYCTIENNLFENADGEGVEIVSLKSNHNIVRNNTIITSCGGLVNRRGSNNVFENNIILGEYKPRTLGIRVANKNNTVINNYISNVALSGIVLMCGEYTDTILTNNYSTTTRMKSGKMVREPSYGAVKYCQFRNNTIINSKTYGIEIGFGYKKDWDKKQIILIPEENNITNNLIIHSKAQAIYTVKQDIKYPLNKFLFKPNVVNENLILNDTSSLSRKNELFILAKNKMNVGIDYSKLHLLKTVDVGPDWMK